MLIVNVRKIEGADLAVVLRQWFDNFVDWGTTYSWIQVWQRLMLQMDCAQAKALSELGMTIDVDRLLASADAWSNINKCTRASQTIRTK